MSAPETEVLDSKSLSPSIEGIGNPLMTSSTDDSSPSDSPSFLSFRSGSSPLDSVFASNYNTYTANNYSNNNAQPSEPPSPVTPGFMREIVEVSEVFATGNKRDSIMSIDSDGSQTSSEYNTQPIPIGGNPAKSAYGKTDMYQSTIYTVPTQSTYPLSSSPLSSSPTQIPLNLTSPYVKNIYLQQRHSKVLNINTTYENLRSALIDAAEKRNASKALTTLRLLFFYDMERDLFDSVLNLFTSDDKKLIRTLHCVLQDIPNITQNNFQTVKNVMTKEVGHKELARKMTALKSFAAMSSHYADSLFPSIAIETLTGVLKKVQEDKPEKKTIKRGFSTKIPFGKQTDLGRERSLVQYSALLSARLLFTPNNISLYINSVFLQYIVEGFRSQEPVASRHAVALAYQYAVENVEVVLEVMRKFLPQIKDREEINLDDTLARVYYIRILFLILRFLFLKLKDEGKSAASDSNVTGNLNTDPSIHTNSKLYSNLSADFTTFYDALCLTVLDRNDKVCYEAITWLAKLPWKKLETAAFLANVSIVPSSEGASSDGVGLPGPAVFVESPKKDKSLLSGVIHRVQIPLEKADNEPLVHAALRTLKLLCQSYSYYAYALNQAGAEQPHPLQSLLPHLARLLKHHNHYIRVQAIQCLIWYIRIGDQPEDLGLFTGPESAVKSVTLRKVLVEEWKSQTLPIRMVDDVMSELASRVASTPLLYDVVLEIVYELYLIIPTAFNVHIITGIYETILPLQRKPLLQHLFSILDLTTQKDSLTRLTNLYIHKYIYYFIAENGNLLAGEPLDSAPSSIFETSLQIKNKDLQEVILRLQTAVLSATWELRSLCLEGLMKIALRSSTVVKYHLYDFFLNVEKESNLGLRNEVMGYLDTLDSIFAGQHKWMSVVKNGSLSKEEENKAGSENEAVVSAVKHFCALPNNFRILYQ